MADFSFNQILDSEYHQKMTNDPTGKFFTNASNYFLHLHNIDLPSCKNDEFKVGATSRYDPNYVYFVDTLGNSRIDSKPYFSVYPSVRGFPFGSADPLVESGSFFPIASFNLLRQAKHKFVIYVNIVKMTDTVTEYRQKAIPPLEVKRGLYNGDMGFGGSYEGELTDDNFDNYYRVESIDYYINDDDGNYSEVSPRSAYVPEKFGTISGRTFVFVPYQVQNYERNGEKFDYGISAVGIILENVLGVAPRGTNSRTTGVNYVNGIAAEICGYENKAYYENSTGLLQGGFNELATRTDIYKRVYFTKETIQKILKDFGIPYSFDINEVLNKNTSDFSDYSKPGKPSNPVYPDEGDGDNSSDPFEIVNPSISPYDTYTTTYLCRKSDINKLSNYIWSGDFVNNVIRLFENPAELITNNVFFPFSLTENQTLHDPEQIKIGNLNAPTDVTGIPAGQIYNRRRITPYYEYTSYYGNFLDYNPYSKYFLYLPYIGFVDIDGNDVIKHQIHIEYTFELETGDCTAYFYSDTRLVSQFNGKLGTPIGLSNSNQILKNLGYVTAIIKTGVGVATAVASQGQYGTSDIVGGIKDFVSNFSEQTINVGDKVGGLNGLYGPQDVYLVIFHAVPAEAENLKEIFGKSASYGGTVSEFSGFLQCSAVDGYTKGTDEENNEIFELLRGGIYV